MKKKYSLKNDARTEEKKKGKKTHENKNQPENQSEIENKKSKRKRKQEQFRDDMLYQVLVTAVYVSYVYTVCMRRTPPRM